MDPLPRSFRCLKHTKTRKTYYRQVYTIKVTTFSSKGFTFYAQISHNVFYSYFRLSQSQISLDLPSNHVKTQSLQYPLTQYTGLAFYLCISFRGVWESSSSLHSIRVLVFETRFGKSCGWMMVLGLGKPLCMLRKLLKCLKPNEFYFYKLSRLDTRLCTRPCYPVYKPVCCPELLLFHFSHFQLHTPWYTPYPTHVPPRVWLKCSISHFVSLRIKLFLSPY